MNHYLPEPTPTAPAAGQAERNAAINHQADQLMAAINGITPTQHPDARPKATIGTAPPVTDQPGTRRPPMSQGAVDLNATLISTSVVIVAIGGAASAILWASGKADPTVIAWVCACAVAAPAILAVPILALKSLMKSAKEVAEATPPQITQHYSGYVDQRSTHVHTKTNGVVSVTRNELPPA